MVGLERSLKLIQLQPLPWTGTAAIDQAAQGHGTSRDGAPIALCKSLTDLKVKNFYLTISPWLV